MISFLGVVTTLAELIPCSTPPATAAKLPIPVCLFPLSLELLAPGLLEAINPDVKAGILALVFPNFLSLTSFRLSLLPFLFPAAGGAIIDGVAKDTEAEWDPVNLVLN